MNLFKSIPGKPGLLLLTTVLLFASSCSKNSDQAPETPTPEPPVVVPGPDKPTDPVPTGSVPFFKIQRVENFAVETDDKNPTEAKTAAYFSLENKEEIKALLAKTARWDIGFNGLYNSFLSANNGTDATNLGYGGSGAGGVTIVKKPFDEVIDIPAASAFSAKGTLIGTDDLGAFGEGTGWYLYDFAGDIRGDKSYDKQHVAYAMPESRTIILRTANGNFAKIKMISCYKDAFTADKWFRNTPHMFFTFEYVLVPKGSTKFEVK